MAKATTGTGHIFMCIHHYSEVLLKPRILRGLGWTMFVVVVVLFVVCCCCFKTHVYYVAVHICPRSCKRNVLRPRSCKRNVLRPHSCKCISKLSYISYMSVLIADRKLAFVKEISVPHSMYTRHICRTVVTTVCVISFYRYCAYFQKQGER